MTTTGRRGERGMSISVELAILLPALVVIIALLVGAGRLALARISVQQWADSAARTATLARDAHSAQARAHAVVASDAGGSDLRCAGGWQLTVDTGAFALPGPSACSGPSQGPQRSHWSHSPR